MDQTNKERFESLVEEEEYTGLVALCKTVIALNEKTSIENGKLKEKIKDLERDKPSIRKSVTEAICFILRDYLFGVIVASIISTILIAVVFLLSLSAPTGNLYVADTDCIRIYREIDWYEDKKASECFTTFTEATAIMNAMQEVTNEGN